MLKECMVTRSNPFLMPPPEDKNFGKAAIYRILMLWGLVFVS